MSRGEEFKPYVVLEKDGKGTKQIFKRKEAQDLVNDGYNVRINKTGWKFNKEEKKTVKKAKKNKKKK